MQARNAGGAFSAAESNAAFASDRRRPQRQALARRAKVSLTTLWLSGWPGVAPRNDDHLETAHRTAPPSYSPLEGAPDTRALMRI
jgi:hypothetical protein